MHSVITPQVNLYLWLGFLVVSIIQFSFIIILLKRNRTIGAAVVQLLMFKELISEILKHDINNYLAKLREQFTRKKSTSYNNYRDMGGGGTASSPVSDIRLKEDISAINVESLQLLNIDPVRFRYVRDNPYDLDSSLRYGFIAQDIEPTIPAAVRTNSDGFLCVDYNCIVALLVKSIKELHGEIDELKMKINRNIEGSTFDKGL
jgi:hypothetical protein